MYFKYFLEWFSWLLLFFSWALLSGAALRRSLRRYELAGGLRRTLYWTCMMAGVIIFVLSLLFIADPITAFLVGMDILAPEQGPVIFLIQAGILLLTWPFIITPVVVRLFRKNLQDKSR